MRSDTQKLLTFEGASLPARPDRIVPDGAFSVDGLRIVAQSTGAAESVANSVYWLPEHRILVSSDLATPTLVPFLFEGRTAIWLENLTALAKAYPKAKALPGHGPSGDLKILIERQHRYLVGYRAHISTAMALSSPGGKTVMASEIARLTATQAAQFRTLGQVAGLPPAKLAQMNAEGVAKEMAANK